MIYFSIIFIINILWIFFFDNEGSQLDTLNGYFYKMLMEKRKKIFTINEIIYLVKLKIETEIPTITIEIKSNVNNYNKNNIKNINRVDQDRFLIQDENNFLFYTMKDTSGKLIFPVNNRIKKFGYFQIQSIFQINKLHQDLKKLKRDFHVLKFK